MRQPLASIHPDAKIAKDVVIDPFVVIEDNVEIGEGSWIGPHTTIMSGARIGKNCHIFPGSIISAIPQDLKFNGEESLVIIGNHTSIREGVTINRGTAATGKTIIGNHCLLMAYAHVAHDCIIKDHVIIGNGTGIAGHVEIHDYAIVSGLCAVHQFVKIGAHVIVAIGSLVRKDVPPYVKAAREPLAYVGINAIGLHRRGFSKQTINDIQEIYRILFQQKMNVSQAVEAIEQRIPPTPERDEILAFIRKSDRGLMKGYVSKAQN